MDQKFMWMLFLRILLQCHFCPVLERSVRLAQLAGPIPGKSGFVRIDL